jgi:hypothetical protein
MKKKIGEIYNIPIVIGNKNEVTKNEIHVGELQGGEKRNIKYYDVTRIDSEGKLGFIYYANASKTPDTIFGAAYLIPMAIDGDLNQEFANRVTAVALDFDSIIIKTAEEEQRVEAIKDFTLQFDLTEITEEEFYSFDN